MTTSYLWCVMQVTLISATGLGLTCSLCRRYPGIGAQVASTATATILVITILIPISLPRIFTPQSNVEMTADSTGSEETTNFKSVEDRSHGQGSPVFFNAMALLSDVGPLSIGNTTSRTTLGWILTSLVTLAVAFMVWGMLRFIVSLRYIVKLIRASVPIEDRHVLHRILQLAEHIEVQRTIILCESAEVASATVVGWRKPRIILPLDWRQWTNDQLLAVLAHELAHIKHKDFIWRLLSSLAGAIHFYHPLIHSLVKRLALSQELAADQLAAATVGGRTRYLKALSQLAISRDDSVWLRTEPIVLPALSTNLIRRINMLRAKDCEQERSAQRGLRGLSAGVIVTLGVVTMVLRSSAEPLNATQAEKTRSVTAAEPPKEFEAFNRAPIDISLVGDNESGVFAIRLGELSHHPAYRPTMNLFNNLLCEVIQENLGKDIAADVHFESIDYIIGLLDLTIKPIEKPSDAQHKNKLMFGSSEVVLRFREDVQWQSWIRRNLPNAEEKSEGDVVYFEYSLMAFGPQPLLIVARDSRTVILAHSLERLKEMADNKSVHQTSDTLATEWQAADRGLLTIVATDKSIESAESTSTEPAEMACRAILQHTRKISIGLDLEEETGNVGLKFSLISEDEQSAESVSEAIEKLIPLAITGLTKQINEHESEHPLESVEVAYEQFCKEFLERISTNVLKRADGSYANEILAVSRFPMQEMMLALAKHSDELETR
ncbi:M56 family metallopeptidase [Bythopirellula goksoeyrii]|uniref:Regulatory protein BlaR1 n=1 Tax=Bythopirellula goksoeyrii TaxID=1400387 RepID=A0A5B9Q621_9BACT|nr:M56 family metallopeptidase [Bythopirellula goksoeyrii]QEG32852.1 Regulatory protein BlaR1 [Bythopirellula goksoeyrii]